MAVHCVTPYMESIADLLLGSLQMCISVEERPTTCSTV